MSPHVRGRRAGEGHNGLRIDLLEGGRYVAIPQNAVNNGYDVLPSRSVKFNTQRDNPHGIFRGFKAGVRAELVRGVPQPLFDVVVISRHDHLKLVSERSQVERSGVLGSRTAPVYIMCDRWWGTLFGMISATS